MMPPTDMFVLDVFHHLQRVYSEPLCLSKVIQLPLSHSIHIINQVYPCHQVIHKTDVPQIPNFVQVLGSFVIAQGEHF